MQWCEKLKFARKVSKLTLRAVEEKTGISNAYLSQLENGQIEEPSFFKMMELINFYNLEVADFIESKPIAVAADRIPFTAEWIVCTTCATQHIQGTMCPKCFAPKLWP